MQLQSLCFYLPKYEAWIKVPRNKMLYSRFMKRKFYFHKTNSCWTILRNKNIISKSELNCKIGLYWCAMCMFAGLIMRMHDRVWTRHATMLQMQQYAMNFSSLKKASFQIKRYNLHFILCFYLLGPSVTLVWLTPEVPLDNYNGTITDHYQP